MLSAPPAFTAATSASLRSVRTTSGVGRSQHHLGRAVALIDEMWRLSLPRTHLEFVHFALDGSYLTTGRWSKVAPNVVLAVHVDVVGLHRPSGKRIVTALVLVSMRAKLEPHELPARARPRSCRCPCDAGPDPWQQVAVGEVSTLSWATSCSGFGLSISDLTSAA